MSNGNHCPQCGKDIGFWPFLVAFSVLRIWCPYCLSRLRVTENIRRSTLISWVVVILTCAISGLLAGMPALSSGLLAGKEFSDDEMGAHGLAFLGFWLIFLCGTIVAVALIQWRKRDLQPVSAKTYRCMNFLRRLVLRSPYSLRCLAGALLVALIAGIIYVSFPLCHWRTLVWNIERTGARVDGLCPPLVDLDAVARFLGPPQRAMTFGPYVRVSCEGPHATDVQLAHVIDILRRFNCRTALYLKNTQITDEALVHVAQVKSLEELFIDNAAITDSGLEGLSGLTNLRALRFDNVRITDAGIHHLADLSKLSLLHLNRTDVNGTGLKHLAQLEELSEIQLRRAPVTDSGIAELSELPHVSSLGLSDTQITDVGVAHLSRLPGLERLNLSGTQISDAGLASLVRAASLKSLFIHRTRITGLGIEHLLELPRLKTLDLSESSVTDADLDRISELQVESLILTKTSVTDASVEGLLKMPKLKYLIMTGTRITDAGFAQLDQARPRLLVSRLR